MTMNNEKIISIPGNYEKLITYKKAVVLYDMTYYLCTHFIGSKDRTFDQMVQAAGSGKQNIVRALKASFISRRTWSNRSCCSVCSRLHTRGRSRMSGISLSLPLCRP